MGFTGQRSEITSNRKKPKFNCRNSARVLTIPDDKFHIKIILLSIIAAFPASLKLFVSIMLGLVWLGAVWHPFVCSLAPSSLWFFAGWHQKHCRLCSSFLLSLNPPCLSFMLTTFPQSHTSCGKPENRAWSCVKEGWDISWVSSMRKDMEDTKDSKRK